MFANSIIQEEMKLNALQRVLLPNYNKSASISVFENDEEISPCQETRQIVREQEQPTKTSKSNFLELDASVLGDLPARYVIYPTEPHQFPVVGVYVDRRVVPGFKYRVRPLPGINDTRANLKCLFRSRALVLKSIGRGYSRRFTFGAEDNCLNDNDNYFWSDNRPEGYAFELEVISEGDKFTVFDVNREAQATAEIMKIEDNQFEIGSSISGDSVEKRVKVKLIAKVEFFETGVAQLMPIGGVAICVKQRAQQNAEITKITNVNIKHHRYYLTPGFQNGFRRVTVRGADINDVPTKYTMTGLEPYEIPVVGTYVDPRILPGFRYRVRPNDRKRHLFDGESLKLVSIGMGYAKRLTFESPSKSNPDNYLWSDNHRDGLGLEPRAVLKDMKFRIIAGDQVLGEAKVFRDDMPQKEEHMEKVKTSSGKFAIVKHILVDVMCHIKLESSERGLSENEHLLRVCGLAIVQKDPNSNEAKVLRVENVGLDSQLNILFAITRTELTFIPLQ